MAYAKSREIGERDRETDRQTDRQTQRDRQRERKGERQRERERQRDCLIVRQVFTKSITPLLADRILT